MQAIFNTATYGQDSIQLQELLSVGVAHPLESMSQPEPSHILLLIPGSGRVNLEVKSQDLWHTKPFGYITISHDLEISPLYIVSSSLIIANYCFKGATTVHGRFIGTSLPLQYSCLENPMDGGAW